MTNANEIFFFNGSWISKANAEFWASKGRETIKLEAVEIKQALANYKVQPQYEDGTKVCLLGKLNTLRYAWNLTK